MILEGVLYLLCAGLSVPVLVLAIQVAMALPQHRPRDMPGGRRPRTAVLVPAHDEAAGIADTLRSIAPQLAPGDQLLVVADNCSDDTAAIAAAAGAEVIERRERELRGKGYALALGVRYLQKNRGQSPISDPEVLIVIDADCRVSLGTIERLARAAAATGRPVQALYEMHARPGGGLGEFAWLVKNHVRPLGYMRLGLPCQLMGTGMAFPWRLVEADMLASGHLAEDMALGLELARRGAPPLFCPEARVTSFFPESAGAAAQQRTRWEHGHLALILRAPRLAAQALARGDVRLLAFALDLCAPPLALVFLLAAGLLALSWLFLLHLTILGAAVLLAWVGYGRKVVPLGTLACAPLYAAAKLPLYARFLVRRQVEWVRTRRGA
jgi:cellulose synthase/poly-beta-1,6-N-acetylglucosamine synthase-like glycosyltransferase